MSRYYIRSSLILLCEDGSRLIYSYRLITLLTRTKNLFLFAYVKCVVAWSMCRNVQAPFLLIGHAHEDIDHAFSKTSERLRTVDAATMSDLHLELRAIYAGNVNVFHLKSVVNWSDLYQTEKVLQKIPAVSQFRHFAFQKFKWMTLNAMVFRFPMISMLRPMKSGAFSVVRHMKKTSSFQNIHKIFCSYQP